MLAGLHTGAAADAAVDVIHLLVHAHNTEIVEVGLYTVIGAACHSHFDVVVGREDQALDLAGQLRRIYVALDAVGVSDAGHDVSGTDGGISGVIDIHVHITHVYFHFFDIVLDELVYFINVLVFDSRSIQGLSGSDVEGSVAPSLADFLNDA